MIKKVLLSGLLLVIVAPLVLIFYHGLGTDKSNIPSPLIGKQLPAFKVALLSDEKQQFDSNTLRGLYSIINVWATWCHTCRIEHDFWLKQSANDPKFQIIGLNYRDEPLDAKNYLATTGNPYDQVLSDNNGQIGILLGVYGTPQTYLIDPNGFVIYKHIGPVDDVIWQQQFKPLIKGLG